LVDRYFQFLRQNCKLRIKLETITISISKSKIPIYSNNMHTLETSKKHTKSNIETTLDFIKEIVQAANEVPKNQ